MDFSATRGLAKVTRMSSLDALAPQIDLLNVAKCLVSSPNGLIAVRSQKEEAMRYPFDHMKIRPLQFGDYKPVSNTFGMVRQAGTWPH